MNTLTSNSMVDDLRRHAGYVERQFPQTAWTLRNIADELQRCAPETSEQHDSIPARPYPGDEEAVRQSGVALPYCSCSRASDDPHTSGCKFWLGILAARKLWMDRNVAAWSCAPEARGEKRCAQWCGHPQFCTASGTDRRRSQKALEQPPVDNDHVADGCEKFDE